MGLTIGLMFVINNVVMIVLSLFCYGCLIVRVGYFVGVWVGDGVIVFDFEIVGFRVGVL